MAKNRVIGSNNVIPWHLPSDLKRFRALTMGHAVIVGRKTYESIGRPLPGRTNIVVTRQKDYPIASGHWAVCSFEEAILLAGSGEMFVIGGEEIYRRALPIAEKIYLTIVHHEFPGDAFFPELDFNEWVEVSREDALRENGLDFSFVVLERKRPAV